MNRLTGEELKEFLKEFGYNWEGLMSRPAKYPFSQAHEVYSVDLEDLISVDRKYILVNTTAIAGDIVGVPNSSVIRAIRTSSICFQIYRPTSTNQKWELEKDLSAEWVRCQAVNIEGYIDETLFDLRHVLASSPKVIQDRKNALAQEIERVTREGNNAIKAMEEDFARSKMAEGIIKQVQQERLIKQQGGLDAKGRF